MSVFDILIQNTIHPFTGIITILAIILVVLRDELNREGPTRREFKLMIVIIILAFIPLVVSAILWGDEIPEVWFPIVTGSIFVLMAAVYLSIFIIAFGTHKRVETASDEP